MNEALSNFLKKKQAPAEKWQRIIEEMLGDYKAYHYAERFLVQMLDEIYENKSLSEGQIKAIENIRNNPAKYHERTPRRRRED